MSVNTLYMSFDQANQCWKDGRITDSEMLSFARRWAEGKGSHRVHDGHRARIALPQVWHRILEPHARRMECGGLI